MSTWLKVAPAGSTQSALFHVQPLPHHWNPARWFHHQIINGGPDGDVIHAGNGNDIVNGHGGNDYLDGGNGNDVLRGGDGDDQLFGGNGNDVLFGDDGNDALSGGNGNDTLLGGNGSDLLTGGAGRDVIDGGTAEDTLDFRTEGGTHGVYVNLATGIAVDTYGTTDAISGIEDVLGTAKGDTFVATHEAAGELFWGLKGADTFIGNGNPWAIAVYGTDAELGGTAGIQVNLAKGYAIDGFGFRDAMIDMHSLIATNSADTIIGSPGDDGFQTLAGDDYIDGGAGWDTVDYSADIFWGATIADHVEVDLVAGTAYGTFSGNDTLVGIESVGGTHGNDHFVGNDFDNGFSGNEGGDFIDARGGNDFLFGGDGTDMMLGDDGNDYLDGGNDGDFLDGGWGDDTVIGGGGDDFIVAGPGEDIVTGGEGADTFAFGGIFGHNQVTDFELGHDVVQFAFGTFADYAGIIAHATDDPAGVTITDDFGYSVELLGIHLGQLTSADLLIA